MRADWGFETRLGALDSDVDEIHVMRSQDRTEFVELVSTVEGKHDRDIKRIEGKLDDLRSTAIKATIAGFSAAATLGANLIWRVVEF